jgi:hypothetical protein
LLTIRAVGSTAEKVALVAIGLIAARNAMQGQASCVPGKFDWQDA